MAMKKHSILLLPLLIILLAAPSTTRAVIEEDPGTPLELIASAGPMPPDQGGPMGPGGPFMRRPFGERGAMREALGKDLGLTQEQQDKLRALRVDFRERTRKTRMALASLSDEKQTMLMSGKVDPDKLTRIDEELVKANSDLMRDRLKTNRERLKVLTPEQIQKLAELKGKRHGGLHRGGGFRGGSGRMQQ
ncbi:MAG: periplasmic heavy metal sensor [Deltaproteobacteria bacterium]|nr:periplasmic heavy metal sensor [Deltaproteobacteria bacterium]